MNLSPSSIYKHLELEKDVMSSAKLGCTIAEADVTVCKF